MPLASFLRSLFEDGRVRVPALVPLIPEGLSSGEKELANFEQLYRLEMPGEPPSFERAAAQWAGVQFFRACQFTVHRDLIAADMLRDFAQPCPCSRSPAVDYSADLVFRFLPDLLTLARSAAENDPLVGQLIEWAKLWPLSSVGVAGLGPLDCSSFLAHPSLLALYADRILARGDASRLSDDRARRAVEAAVGLHRELVRKLPLNKDTPA